MEEVGEDIEDEADEVEEALEEGEIRAKAEEPLGRRQPRMGGRLK